MSVNITNQDIANMIARTYKNADITSNTVPRDTAPKTINEEFQDDDGKSSAILNDELGYDRIVNDQIISGNLENNLYKSALHGANLYTEKEINDRLYNQTFRFGLINPSGTISNCREYLFFTKPDLHIYNCKSSKNVTPDTYGKRGNAQNQLLMQDFFESSPFWVDLESHRKNTIKCLQNSFDFNGDPFNHLLQNSVTNSLDIPGITSETIDTPQNMYGVGFSYRGTSEASDDNPTFSLEFKDTRFLDIYYFFKAYEEYEVLKHHGVISPQKYYILNKILHDQFSIYKFIVADDMETILYFGKMYGVMPTSLPRDAFNNANLSDGITYSIDFKAAFYEDMRPEIIKDFNSLSVNFYNAQKYQINPYNQVLGRSDMRTACAAYVEREEIPEYGDNMKGFSKQAIALIGKVPPKYVYKLKWRGSDQI